MSIFCDDNENNVFDVLYFLDGMKYTLYLRNWLTVIIDVWWEYILLIARYNLWIEYSYWCVFHWNNAKWFGRFGADSTTKYVLLLNYELAFNQLNIVIKLLLLC